MPRYRYTATALSGKTLHGVTEAASAEALYITLREQDLYMTDAKEVGTNASVYRPLKTPELAEFCRSLGTLLSAGVPLVRAFRIMADERGLNARTKLLYNTLLKELRKGVPLSDAMHQCAPAFPELLIAMTRSAEGTGSIDASFLRMGRYYDREHKVNQQVGNSLMYPIILLVMIVGVIAILMGFVVPQFMPMFEQMDSLPLPTVVLFAVSDFVSANWVLIILVAAFQVVGGRIALAQPAVRRQAVDPHGSCTSPVIGKLNQKICTARFARTLSNLYSSGVPIVATLIASRDAVGNRWIISQFDEVLDKVRAGNSLSESLALVDGFEQSMSSSIAVGEETGKLDELLATISETLDFEAEVATKRLVTLLEPIMIVIMGVIVAFVVVAVILPIYQSYGTIGQSSSTY